MGEGAVSRQFDLIPIYIEDMTNNFINFNPAAVSRQGHLMSIDNEGIANRLINFIHLLLEGGGAVSRHGHLINQRTFVIC